MWFKRKRKEDIVVQPPVTSRVEVERAKGEGKEVKQQAMAVNNHLNDLLTANGFTVKIFIAAGAHPPKKREYIDG